MTRTTRMARLCAAAVFVGLLADIAASRCSATILGDAVADFTPGVGLYDLGTSIPAGVVGAWSYNQAGLAPGQEVAALEWDPTSERYERAGSRTANQLDFPTIRRTGNTIQFDPWDLNPEFAMLRWSSGPYSGPLRIRGTYQAPNNSVDGVDVEVFVAGVSLLRDRLDPGDQGVHSFDLTTTVGPIQFLDVAVGQNGVSSFLTDTVHLTLQLDDADPSSIVDRMIPENSQWRYLDDGSNQQTAWRELGFDDSSWPAGAAQLGYGDADEATLIGCGPSAPICNQNNFATTYFRHTFTVDDPSTIDVLMGELLRDDAAAVYLNGELVYRDPNLPEGATFDQYATSLGVENGRVAIGLPTSLLRAGPNVLAVEVHQAGSGSTDVSFDFELRALTHPVPEPASCLLAISGGLAALAVRRFAGVRRRRAGRGAGQTAVPASAG